ncbi:MAG: YecA family protein [Spirochaetia bacterium]
MTGQKERIVQGNKVCFQWMGVDYAGEIHSDPNPNHSHGQVTVTFHNETGGNPFSLTVNLDKRAVECDKQQASDDFIEEFASLLTEDDWLGFEKQFYLQTDLTLVMPKDFSVDDFGQGDQVSFKKLYPKGDEIVFWHGDNDIILEDSYFVDQGDDCTRVGLHVSYYTKRGECDTFLGYEMDFATGEICHAFSDVYETCQEAIDLIQVVQDKLGLSEILKKRHIEINAAYKKWKEAGNSCKKRTSFSEAEPVSDMYVEKVGRNEPCPCGSGKKYKKCCLNKKPIISWSSILGGK